MNLRLDLPLSFLAATTAATTTTPPMSLVAKGTVPRSFLRLRLTERLLPGDVGTGWSRNRFLPVRGDCMTCIHEITLTCDPQISLKKDIMQWEKKNNMYLENLVYHSFRQLWLVLGVKLMEINSNLFSRYFIYIAFELDGLIWIWPILKSCFLSLKFLYGIMGDRRRCEPRKSPARFH